MKLGYKRLGDYIQLVDERNRNLEVTNLLGISVTKNFIPSVANTIGTNMANYKVIRKNQFACSIMQVRRDKKMPVALYLENDPSIISQAYPIFEIIDETLLLPEYLMMWFTRSEFDREACFLAVGGVRGSLEWEDFLNMQLPIPSLEKQKEIVKEYETVENRIQLNKKLCTTLEETAQTIYKHWFEDFEFPDEKGKPYKSSGGEMIFNEDLQKKIPARWHVKSLGDIINYRKGYAFKSTEYIDFGKSIIRVSDLSIKYVSNSDFYKTKENKLLESYIVAKGDLIITTVGSWSSNPLSVVGRVVRVPSFAHGFYLNQNMVRIRLDKSKNEVMYQQLMTNCFSEYLISGAQGSANQASITLEHIFSFKVLLSNEDKLNSELTTLYDTIELKILETQKLEELKSLLLGKMTVEM